MFLRTIPRVRGIGARAAQGSPAPRVAFAAAALGAWASAAPLAGQQPAAGWCPAPYTLATAAARGASAAPSFSGGPGLFDVPTATAFPEGEMVLSVNEARSPDSRPDTRWQRNGMLTVAFLPRLSLTGRAAVRVVGDVADKRDLSANAQFLAVEEKGWRPALMLGANDVSGGAQNYTATYAALTKSVAGRLRLTGGYGQGRQLLDGPFGGVELSPCAWVSLIAEHAGPRSSAGVRLTPFPALAQRTGLRLTLDAARIEPQGWTGGVGVRWAAGPARAHRPAPVPPAVAATPRAFGPAVGTVPQAVTALYGALEQAGFENLRVVVTDSATLRVDYENRRWLLDDMDGVGTVLGIVAARAPAAVHRVEVVIRAVDIPLLSVTTWLEPLRAYLADPWEEGPFVQQLELRYPSASDPGGARVANRSRFRVDLTVRPRLETVSMFEGSAFESRGSLLPEFKAQLGRGLVISGRRNVELWQSDRFLTGLEDPGADRLLLHAATRLPAAWLPRGAISVGQLSVGRLGQRQVGAAWDQEVTLAGGRWSMGVSGALFGRAISTVDRSYAFATVRWRRPEQELRTALSWGVYQFGDVGIIADVVRRFGVLDVGFRLRSTDLTSQAGILMGIPLSPRRQLRPSRVRVTTPDFYELLRETVVFQSANYIRADVARSLDTGHEVARAYGGRDWLRPGTLRARAWAIRNAALRAP